MQTLSNYRPSVCLSERTWHGQARRSATGRYCCKSRKLQGSRFFAKTLSKRSLIRMTSIALSKSPVNFARGRDVPHILYTKVAPTARRILVIGEKRLLQHQDDHCAARSVDPSLLHRRDRQRQLAVQKPRRRRLRHPRSSRLRYPGRLRRDERYQKTPPRKGVKIGRG
jgi:hypothetical protein